jgi:hypothetical protein
MVGSKLLPEAYTLSARPCQAALNTPPKPCASSSPAWRKQWWVAVL